MQTLPQWFSDLSAVATLVCFVITLVQVFKLNQKTNQIQDKLQKAFAISDLAKICEIIKMIDVDFSNRNFQLAHSKMQEVRNLIIEIKEIPGLQEHSLIKDLDSKKRFLNRDIQLLKESIFVNKTEVSDKSIKSYMSNLDNISVLLLTLNAQLKNERDE